MTESAVRRINRAQAHIPRLRDLKMMKDLLERQPYFAGLADRLYEVDVEIRTAEAALVETLCTDAG